MGYQRNGKITHPEIILGEKLPDSCIKWTKDLRLLYKKETKIKENKEEIDLENEWGGPEKIVTGTEFGGVVFHIENDKVKNIFIRASAE